MQKNKNLTLNNFKSENTEENLKDTNSPKRYKLADIFEATEILAIIIAGERNHRVIIGFDDEYVPPCFNNILHCLNEYSEENPLAVEKAEEKLKKLYEENSEESAITRLIISRAKQIKLDKKLYSIKKYSDSAVETAGIDDKDLLLEDAKNYEQEMESTVLFLREHEKRPCASQ